MSPQTGLALAWSRLKIIKQPAASSASSDPALLPEYAANGILKNWSGSCHRSLGNIQAIAPWCKWTAQLHRLVEEGRPWSSS
jgi:hypothetical protein